MSNKLKWLLGIAPAAAITALMLVPLINPVYTSIGSYNKYRGLKQSPGHGVANLRSIESKYPVFGVFGYCYETVDYDFVANGKVFNGSDKLDCRWRNKLIIGNSIPIIYDLGNPLSNISSYTIATSMGSVVRFCINLGFWALAALMGVVFNTRSQLTNKLRGAFSRQ